MNFLNYMCYYCYKILGLAPLRYDHKANLFMADYVGLMWSLCYLVHSTSSGWIEFKHSEFDTNILILTLSTYCNNLVDFAIKIVVLSTVLVGRNLLIDILNDLISLQVVKSGEQLKRLTTVTVISLILVVTTVIGGIEILINESRDLVTTVATWSEVECQILVIFVIQGLCVMLNLIQLEFEAVNLQLSSCESHELDEIISIQSWYFRTLKLKNRINNLFSAVLVLFVVQHFFQIFHFLTGIQVDWKMFRSVCDGVTIITQILILTTVSSAVTMKSQLTGPLLHGMESESKEVQLAITAFSTQLLQSADMASVTAGSLFAIDVSLLGSMAATMLTYFIITVQWILSEKQIELRETEKGNLSKY